MLTIPEGNYTGVTLSSTIQELLDFAISFEFEVVYNAAKGSITIKSNYDGMTEKPFIIPTDFEIMAWANVGADYPWVNREGTIQSVDVNNIQFINGVLRNSDNEFVPLNLQSEFYRTYESGFLDLLSIHNIYMHCPNLGHFNSIGVRGESSIIKQHPSFK